jgi:hypothetical protein
MFYRIALIGMRTIAGIVQLLPEDEQAVLFEHVVGEATNLQSASSSGAIQILMADGSVRFVSAGISLSQYQVGTWSDCQGRDCGRDLACSSASLARARSTSPVRPARA